MARAHAIVAVVEDTTHQQRLRIHPGRDMICGLLGEPGSDRFEEVAVQNGRLLSGICLWINKGGGLLAQSCAQATLSCSVSRTASMVVRSSKCPPGSLRVSVLLIAVKGVNRLGGWALG